MGLEESRSSWTQWASAASAASWLLAVASPFVFYFAVTRNGLNEGALFVLAFAALRALPTVVASKPEHRRAALRLPAVAILAALAGVVTGQARALLVVPSLSQAAFAGVFLGSLRGTPLVEHFARMQKPKLSAAEIRYCWSVTLVWGVILSAAALAGLALAAWASIEVWTAVTGVGNYVLVGVVFSVEYIVRKIRFREYGSMPVDRVLSKVFPPQKADDRRDLELEIGGDGPVTVPIPPDYVFFRGHFPKAPMLPGVVQLSEIVLPIVRQRHPELGALRQLRRVRFKRPVLPGETLQVDLGGVERLAGDRADVRFDLRIGAAIVASGALSFEVAPSP